MSALPKPAPGSKSRVLPQLRQDLKLYDGPRHLDGSPSWRVLDPVRNRFFEIGWLEFELLARWADHRDAASLAEQVSSETTIDATEEEVAGFADFLIGNQLVVPQAGEERARLRSRWHAAKKPWYVQLFHNYLFFRIPLVDPDRFLDRTLFLVELFFTRAFAVLVLGVLCADLYLLTRDLDELRRTFVYFFNLQGGLYYLLAASFSKVIHEFAHAYAAKRYGVRVPAMGVAFLVLAPFLYTDTGETWKLADRRKQLTIASAGMVAELTIAVFATLFWSLAVEGPVKNVLFILATTTWVMTLAVNASPFMRFDGYFVLSDALDFPNLHDRSGACARWWIRRTFFGMRLELPEPTLTALQRFWLVVFAFCVWAYRLVVFLGIALLVYHMFFKLLGIVLMVLELIWFIVRPVWVETAYLWTHRREIRLRPVPLSSAFALALLMLWMVPVQQEVTAAAVLRAEQEQPIYAPFPAKIVRVYARPGQMVEKGDVLFQLDAPELHMRAKKAAVSLASAELEYQRATASAKQQERQWVLAEEIGSALAEQKSVFEEMQRLTIRAGMRGAVRDMAPAITVGRWVNSRELLTRLVEPEKAVIEAYVSESNIASVKQGQLVKFISSVAGSSAVRGVVRVVEVNGSKQIERPLLAAPHGGDIPAVSDRNRGLVANDPHYRVLIVPVEDSRPAHFVERGTVRIETDLVVLVDRFLARAISVFVRESGI